ncbi:hypothetical protein H0H87_005788 [Tephrocybe sp. NHM501043]|nr:hypothetical protein H0H87_005788 [Tephrocybe sp. NHM501043]
MGEAEGRADGPEGSDVAYEERKELGEKENTGYQHEGVRAGEGEERMEGRKGDEPMRMRPEKLRTLIAETWSAWKRAAVAGSYGIVERDERAMEPALLMSRFSHIVRFGIRGHGEGW